MIVSLSLLIPCVHVLYAVLSELKCICALFVLICFVINRPHMCCVFI